MPDSQVTPYIETPPSSQAFQSSSYVPPSSAPLMERRRRSATTSTVPSQLTVITSSLSGCTREDLVTSRVVPPSDQGTGSSPEPPKTVPDLSQLQAPSAPFLSVTEHALKDSMDPSAPCQPLSGDLLSGSMPDVGFNFQPHDASFSSSSPSAQGFASSAPMPSSYDQYLSALSMPSSSGFTEPLYAPLDPAADLESYTMGLRQYGIYAPHEVYGTPDELLNPYSFYFTNPEEHN